MPQVEVVMTADEASLWQAMQRVATGAQQGEKAIAGVGKAAREAAREQQQLERAAAKVWESTRTPMEQYRAQFEKLQALQQKGIIDDQTFSRGALQAQKAFELATGSAKKFDEAEAQAAVGAKRLEDAARKVFESARTPMEQYTAKVAELKDLLAKGAIDDRTFAKAAIQAQKSFELATGSAKKFDEAEAQAAVGAKRLEDAARRVYDSTRTPAERHNVRMRELNDLVRRGAIDQETYRRAAARSAGELQNVERSGVAAFGERALTQLGVIAGSYLSLHGTLRLITAELEAQAKLRSETADRTRTVAGSQAEALRNLAASSPKQQQAFIAGIEDLSKRYAVEGGQQTLYDVASQALSSTAGDVKQAMNIAAVTATVARDSREAMAQTAGALGDMSKATGWSNAEQNLGALLAIGQVARIPKMADLAKNVAPSLLALRGYGSTWREGGALLAAGSQAFGDTTGEETATQVATLAGKLEDALPALKSTHERIQYFRAHPEERDKWLADTKDLGRAKYRPIVEQFLGARGGDAGRLYDRILSQMPADGALVGRAREMGQMLYAPLGQQVAEGKRLQDAMVENVQLNTVAGKARAIDDMFSADALDKLLEQAGAGATERMLFRVAQATRRGATSQRGAFSGPSQMDSYAAVADEWVAQLNRTGRPEDRQLAATIRESADRQLAQAAVMITELKALREDLARNTRPPATLGRPNEDR